MSPQEILEYCRNNPSVRRVARVRNDGTVGKPYSVHPWPREYESHEFIHLVNAKTFKIYDRIAKLLLNIDENDELSVKYGDLWVIIAPRSMIGGWVMRNCVEVIEEPTFRIKGRIRVYRSEWQKLADYCENFRENINKNVVSKKEK